MCCNYVNNTMPKLHLKRTPQEEAARQWRKQNRRKHSHNAQNIDIGGASTSASTTRKYHYTEAHLWASSDKEPEESHPAYQGHCRWSSDKSYDVVHDEEDQRFREKMIDALHDDEYLDSLEARLNSFAHLPERWRSARGSKPNNICSDRYGVDDISQLDPQEMDDEEYAEWIRLGMYRYVHPIYMYVSSIFICRRFLGRHMRRSTQSAKGKEL